MKPLLFFVSLLLSACSLLSQRADGFPPKSALNDFALEGRFVLKSGPERYSGRLRFLHEGKEDQFLLLSPFGQAVAELVLTSEGARLKGQDMRVIQAQSSSELTQRFFGFSLPLEEIRGWLLGKYPKEANDHTYDEAGRLLSWVSEAWQVFYEYDALAASSEEVLPRVIEIKKNDTFSFRLQVYDWQAL